jgi:hypothetical protein
VTISSEFRFVIKGLPCLSQPIFCTKRFAPGHLFQQRHKLCWSEIRAGCSLPATPRTARRDRQVSRASTDPISLHSASGPHILVGSERRPWNPRSIIWPALLVQCVSTSRKWPPFSPRSRLSWTLDPWHQCHLTQRTPHHWLLATFCLAAH